MTQVDCPDAAGLDALLAQVKDEPSFVRFITALGEDFARERVMEAGKPVPFAAGPLGWENGTVDAMLKSAAAWASETVSAEQPLADQNPWGRCAHILYAGKWYE